MQIKWTMRLRLYMGFGLCATITLFTGIMLIQRLQEANARLHTLHMREIPKLQALNDAASSLMKVSGPVRTLLIPGLTEKDTKTQVEAFVKYWKESDEAMATVRDSGLSKETLQDLDDKVNAWRTSSDEIMAGIANGKRAEMVPIAVGPARKIRNAAEKAVEEQIHAMDKLMVKERKASEQAATAATQFAYVLLGLALTFAIGLGYVLANVISRPMQNAAHALARVGAGDLTVRLHVKGNDEIAQLSLAANQMLGQLDRFVASAATSAKLTQAQMEELVNISRNIRTSTEQISHAVDEVAKGATYQAQSSESLMTASQDLEAQVTQVKQQAKKQDQLLAVAQYELGKVRNAVGDASNAVVAASRESELVMEQARHGAGVAHSCVEAMERTLQTNETAAHLISELGAKSEQISDIVKAIEGIAEQTNLLALNAAIEAARAGEHGRGFAVVADEVRKLAESSRGQTLVIVDLIESVQRLTHDAVQATEMGTSELANGVELVRQTGAALMKIEESVQLSVDQTRNVMASTEDVRSAATRLESGISDISESSNSFGRSFDKMEGVGGVVTSAISKTAALSQEAAATAEEVSAGTQTQAQAVRNMANVVESVNGTTQDLLAQIESFKVSEAEGETKKPDLKVA